MPHPGIMYHHVRETSIALTAVDLGSNGEPGTGQDACGALSDAYSPSLCACFLLLGPRTKPGSKLMGGLSRSFHGMTMGGRLSVMRKEGREALPMDGLRRHRGLNHVTGIRGLPQAAFPYSVFAFLNGEGERARRP